MFARRQAPPTIEDMVIQMKINSKLMANNSNKAAKES